MSAASIAINRFGLGAQPGDVPPADPKRWLATQLDRFDVRPAAIAALPSRRVVAGQLGEYLTQIRPIIDADSAMGPGAAPMATAMSDDSASGKQLTDGLRQFLRGQGRDNYAASVGARTTVAMTSAAPFVERMTHFWSNHFAVSADKLTVIGMAGLLEFEAIRPHVLGKFADMLNAVERHPAMLLYLDQARSIGPNSPIGLRVSAGGRRKIGINENLAREILELHTLGVRTGYDQADVTEFARALTGWTVAGLTRGPRARLVGVDGAPGDFVFAAPVHEPGARQIMGKRYDQLGMRQAQAVLDDLARHPATATHIATKLCRHFAGDTPPPTMIARVRAAFVGSDGDLPTVYRAIFASPEAWAAPSTKFRTPWDWAVASLRAVGAREVPGARATGLMTQLGQPVWRPGSPAGFDDIDASWAGPDAIIRRVEAAERIAAAAGDGIDARRLAETLFPGTLSAATARALARAESPGQALALLLVSPEAMRR